MQLNLRKIVRSNTNLYRFATGMRAVLHSCILPPLPREVKQEIGRYPALGQFVRRARRRRNRAAAFADLVATPFITEYLNYELGLLARGEPSRRVTGYLRGFPIVQTPEFTLRVRFVDNTMPREIYSLQRDTMISPLSHAIEVRRYTVPGPAQCDMFEKTARLSECGTMRLQPGEVAAFRARSQAYVAVPSSPHMAMLVLEDHRTTALSWRFGTETLSCTGAISSDPSVSRLRETLELVAALRLAGIAGAAQSLLDHPSHLVRWSAISAIIRLSRQDAVRVLRRGARDPHPQLRRAAQRLLQQELSHGTNA